MADAVAPQPGQVILRDAASGQWLSFSAPVEIVQARQVADVLPALLRIQQAVEQEGLWAVGYIAYEAAPAFDGVLKVITYPPAPFPSGKGAGGLGDLPLLWFGIYREPTYLSSLSTCPAHEYTSTYPPTPSLKGGGDSPFPSGKGAGGIGNFPEAGPPWRISVSRTAYRKAIERIKDYIARGDTYQVNYTVRLRREWAMDEDAWALFCRLAQAQQAGYSAYLDLGRFAICSASPELFFQLEDGRLLARPMKGTARRSASPLEDRELAGWLYHSEKNRAENVMIVDMLRNDMGKIAVTGSVSVPRLFEIEGYPTVWQMTSTVTCTTRARLCEIMTALFPCASITGAPKPRTMQIIAALEDSPRQVYTGCIGFVAPGGVRAQFNVAIRTALVDRAAGRVEYGVGGGIVWDSTAEDEYEECLVKARVLGGQIEEP